MDIHFLRELLINSLMNMAMEHPSQSEQRIETQPMHRKADAKSQCIADPTEGISFSSRRQTLKKKPTSVAWVSVFLIALVHQPWSCSAFSITPVNFHTRMQPSSHELCTSMMDQTRTASSTRRAIIRLNMPSRTRSTSLCSMLSPDDFNLLVHQHQHLDPSTFISSLIASEPAQNFLQQSQQTLHSYENLLKTNPISTKAITSGILATIGDAIAQLASPPPSASDTDQDSSSWIERYDAKRGLAFLLFGAAYTGAFQHFWFNFLSHNILDWGSALQLWGGPSSDSALAVDELYNSPEWWTYFDVVNRLDNPPSDATLAVAKLALNQFGMVPLVYMPCFFALTGALAGLSPQQSLERAQSMYWPILKRNYIYWLPVQFFQFFAVAPEWQIPFVSAASLVWTVILSSIASQQQQQEEPQDEVSQPVVAASSVLNDEEEGIVEQVITAIQGDATENVGFEDVQELLPSVAQPRVVGGATVGGLFALLASSANEAILPSKIMTSVATLMTTVTLPDVVDTNPMMGTIVAFLTALGAGTGVFVSTSSASTSLLGDDDGEDRLPTNVAVLPTDDDKDSPEKVLVVGNSVLHREDIDEESFKLSQKASHSRVNGRKIPSYLVRDILHQDAVAESSSAETASAEQNKERAM